MPRLIALVALLLLPLPLAAQTTPPEAEAEPPMTLERLDAIVRAIDPEVQTNGTMWQFTVNEVIVLVVTDEDADRMRAITPVRKAEDVTPEELTRLMQANFDSALDARYAIANDLLWSAFIHPLKPLGKNQLISGIGQVVNLAQSYGTLYSGGALQYGGGDSGALQRALIDDLLKRGEEI
jgi:hypothetical protein